MRSKTPRVTDAMRSRSIVRAARAYVEVNDWPLVGIHGVDRRGRCTCGNKGCASPGKHPIPEFFPKGVESATKDPELISAMVAKYPNANIACVLEGLTGVDVDGREGEKVVEGLALPATATILTGRGHDHLFRGELPTGTTKATELDLLSGPRRYVMLPPSTHVSGQVYTWEQGEDSFASLPPRLVEFAIELKGKRRTPGFQKSQPIPHGQRNDALFRAACAFRLRIDDDILLLEMLRAINRKLVSPPLPDRDLETIVKSSGRYETHKLATFGPPAIRTPLPMEFLWYPYIPRHGLTLLVGDPGQGKSLLSELIAAIVSSGGQFPMSRDRQVPGRVTFLAAEDDWARTTLPRLLKAGADIDQFNITDRFRALDEQNMLALQRHLQECRPDLLVVDTLATFMGGERDMHRQNDVQAFLADLAFAARDTGTAILAVGHMNKQSGEHPIYRVNGSIGFAAGVRSILYFGKDPDDPARRALAHGKTNVSEKGNTIVFSFEGGGRKDVPILRPIGFSEHDEMEVCRVEKRPPGRPNVEQERGAEFVLNVLGKQPIPWREVLVKGERIALSAATLNLVRAALAHDGKIEQVGAGPNARWRKS